MGDIDTNQFSLHIITSFDELLASKKHWLKLVSESDDIGLAGNFEFISSWWRGFGGESDWEMRVVVVTNESQEWIAVATMLLEKTRYRGFPCRVLRFFENGYVPSCNVLMNKQFAKIALNIVLDYLFSFKDWDALHLCKVPSDSELKKQLKKRSWEKDLPQGQYPSIETPKISLEGSWEDFIKKRSKSFRKQLRNKQNRFFKEQDTQIVPQIVSEENADELLDSMIDVSSASWKHDEGTDLQGIPGAVAFLKMFFNMTGERKNVVVWEARKGEKVIAYELHIQLGDVVYPLRADFNELYRDISPGSVLEAQILQKLFGSQGIATYYSCGTTYKYLMRWTNQTISHELIEIFSPRNYSKLLYIAEYQVMPVTRRLRRFIFGVYDKHIKNKFLHLGS